MDQLSVDVLRQIVMLLDDETIGKLLCPDLWPILRGFLRDQNFWYERAHVYLRVSLAPLLRISWQRVYYLALITDPLQACIESLDNLALLEVAMQLHNYPSWIGDIEASELIWEQLSDKWCLFYLLEHSHIADEHGHSIDGLYSAAERGCLDVVRACFDICGEEYVETALTYAVRGNSLAVVQYLLRSNRDRVIGSSGVLLAIEHASLDILQLMLRVRDPAQCTNTDLAVQAIRHSRLDVLQLFRDKRMKISWRAVLNSAVASENLDIVRYLMQHMSCETGTNQTLKIAVRQSPEMLQLVLSDPDVDPMTDVLEVIRLSNSYLARRKKLVEAICTDRATESYVPEKAKYSNTVSLLRDPRVRTELLDVQALRLLFWVSYPSDSIDGYNYANEIVSSELEICELQDTIEDTTDTYAMVLRYIILKSPSAVQLLHWLIELQDRSLALAACDVLHNESEAPITLRALLLSITQENLGLREVLRKLGRVTRRDTILAARLVGAYMGKRRIVAQEATKS